MLPTLSRDPAGSSSSRSQRKPVVKWQLPLGQPHAPQPSPAALAQGSPHPHPLGAEERSQLSGGQGSGDIPGAPSFHKRLPGQIPAKAQEQGTGAWTVCLSRSPFQGRRRSPGLASCLSPTALGGGRRCQGPPTRPTTTPWSPDHTLLRVVGGYRWDLGPPQQHGCPGSHMPHLLGHVTLWPIASAWLRSHPADASEQKPGTPLMPAPPTAAGPSVRHPSRKHTHCVWCRWAQSDRPCVRSEWRVWGASWLLALKSAFPGTGDPTTYGRLFLGEKLTPEG